MESSLLEMLNDLSNNAQLPIRFMKPWASHRLSNPSGFTDSFSRSVPVNVFSFSSISRVTARRHQASAIVWSTSNLLVRFLPVRIGSDEHFHLAASNLCHTQRRL